MAKFVDDNKIYTEKDIVPISEMKVGTIYLNIKSGEYLLVTYKDDKEGRIYARRGKLKTNTLMKQLESRYDRSTYIEFCKYILISTTAIYNPPFTIENSNYVEKINLTPTESMIFHCMIDMETASGVIKMDTLLKHRFKFWLSSITCKFSSKLESVSHNLIKNILKSLK